MIWSRSAFVRFPQLAACAVDRSVAALPLMYLSWALPFLLVVAVVTPPWQNPDEPAHMLRISQIADGGLFGYRFGTTAGGIADPALWQSINAMTKVMAHREQKVSLGMLASAGSVAWSNTSAELGFPNTAEYPPVLYAPAVLAVEVGRLLGLSVVHSQIAARMAAAVVSALVAALALSLARRTRPALAALLLLPMTVAQFASEAPDGLMIALTLAVVACIDRAIVEERDPTLRETVLIGVATALVITARPPYLALAALPLVCMRRRRRAAWCNAGAVLAVSVAWTGYILARVSVPLRPYTNPAVQTMYLLHRPWAVVPIAVNTLAQMHRGYEISFIGVLGWLDTILDAQYYDFAWLVLLLAFAGAATGPTRRPWLPLLIALLGFAGICCSEYIIWTAPQADHVEGVSGRYFIVLAAVLALAVPTWRPFGEALRRPVLVAVLGFAAATPLIVVHALILRYFVVP